MGSTKIIAGVEIGTSKVVVLVGEVVPGHGLNIIGMGQSTSVGMRKGEIEDLSAVSDCTHAAILSAEKSAGSQIEHVYLSKSGPSLVGMSSHGVTSVNSPDNVVSAEDVRRACENAKSKALPAGRIYVHHMRSAYRVDGQLVHRPIGQIGSKLEALYWHVHANERAVSNHIHVINGFGLDVDDMIVSSIASGSILTTETEKKQGVLVVDIGSGTTDYALYREGRVVRTGVIPVGGDHLTNDLSLGLRISPKMGESVKLRYAKAIIDKSDKDDSVLLHGDLTIGDRPIPRVSIYKIAHSRMEELFMILKNRLGSVLNTQNLPGGVILTGGSSRLPGIDQLAEDTMGVPARLGGSPAWVTEKELREPEYACSLGLLYYGYYGQQSEEDNLPRRRSKGWARRVMELFSTRN